MNVYKVLNLMNNEFFTSETEYRDSFISSIEKKVQDYVKYTYIIEIAIDDMVFYYVGATCHLVNRVKEHLFKKGTKDSPVRQELRKRPFRRFFGTLFWCEGDSESFLIDLLSSQLSEYDILLNTYHTKKERITNG